MFRSSLSKASAASFLCFLGLWSSPSQACVEWPTNPPEMTVEGDACQDGFLTVTLHDYSTFAASGDFCACALNLPLGVGEVQSAQIVNATTGLPLSNFNFAANGGVDFGSSSGEQWQGFLAAVGLAVGGIEVDLVFTVIPARGDGQGQPCETFDDVLQTALEDPPGGVIIGTGGADADGTPNHHVAVLPGGGVHVAHKSNCPEELALKPCSIDLISGEKSEGCGTYDIGSIRDSNNDRFMEAVLAAEIPDKCERVCVVLDYGDKPQGWTFNIGDSSTNNGYGGNAGGPEAEAEAQILDHQFTTYSVDHGPGLLDRVASQGLALRDSGYKVCVSDQTITYGQSASQATTPFSKNLFAIPDPTDGNRRIFIGLNRVIADIAGAPSAGRVGSGLLRAHITID